MGVELRHYRPRPSHPDWPSLLAAAQQQAAELLPTLKRPARDWREARRRLRGLATAADNYLRNRSLVKAGREDLRPLYFIWTMLRSCNFACEYCDDHRGRKYPDLPNEGVLDTDAGRKLLRIMRTGTPSVYFAGGEPTLRKDLPELTREAYELGYYPITINTNGSGLHRQLRQERWRGWLADMDVIIVSLDALDLQALERMWVYRKPGQVLQNLLLLRELSEPLGFKLMVNTVIQPGQIQHARDVLDLANDLGIWFCPVPLNIGPRMDNTLLDDADYRALAELILQRQRQGNLVSGSARINRRMLNSEPLECRNTLKPHVDFDGKVIWPCKACIHVEPEGIDVLQFDNLEQLYSHACRLIDPTRFHGPAKNQCGANCNWAQNYTTDAYAHGLRHPVSLLGEVSTFLRRGKR